MQRSNERDHIDQHCEQSFSVIHMDASEDVRVLERKQKILQLLKKKELRIEEIKSELEDGPFINAVDMYGNSVLHLVIERIEDKRNEHIGFIQFLLDRGADLCLKNTGGYSPFLWAALKNKVGAMEVLAGCKRNVVNDINNNGDTALHLAIERDHIEAVAFLQELSKTHEFNMDIRSKGSHMTPRELALSKSPRNEKIVNILDGNFQDYYVKKPGSPQMELKQCYKMSSHPRGMCCILQNDTFHESKFDRIGCNDAERLAKTFARLKFEIIKDVNLTALQMLEKIKTLSAADHSKYDCFVLCISTHGESDKVLGTDGNHLPVHHIIQRFSGRKCTSLIGKPKLFFISACRSGASTRNQGLDDDKDADGGGISDHIFPNAVEKSTQKPINLEDIFEGYSTPYGMV